MSSCYCKKTEGVVFPFEAGASTKLVPRDELRPVGYWAASRLRQSAVRKNGDRAYPLPAYKQSFVGYRRSSYRECPTKIRGLVKIAQTSARNGADKRLWRFNHDT